MGDVRGCRWVISGRYGELSAPSIGMIRAVRDNRQDGHPVSRIMYVPFLSFLFLGCQRLKAVYVQHHGPP